METTEIYRLRSEHMVRIMVYFWPYFSVPVTHNTYIDTFFSDKKYTILQQIQIWYAHTVCDDAIVEYNLRASDKRRGWKYQISETGDVFPRRKV